MNSKLVLYCFLNFSFGLLGNFTLDAFWTFMLDEFGTRFDPLWGLSVGGDARLWAFGWTMYSGLCPACYLALDEKL